MNLAYGKNGVVGVLVPQANTTAEPEFDILLGPGVAQLTARMVSPAPAMEDRLVTYMERLGDWIGQFDDAPLGAVAFACTGSSYVVGAAREAAAVAAAEAACGCAVVTSGRAVLMALGVLGARRVAFVSPYGPGLTERSLEYWQAGGSSRRAWWRRVAWRPGRSMRSMRSRPRRRSRRWTGCRRPGSMRW